MHEAFHDAELRARRDYCEHENQGRCACHDGKLERDIVNYLGHRVAFVVCVFGLALMCALIISGTIDNYFPMVK